MNKIPFSGRWDDLARLLNPAPDARPHLVTMPVGTVIWFEDQATPFVVGTVNSSGGTCSCCDMGYEEIVAYAVIELPKIR